jgi:hypothetical protein
MENIMRKKISKFERDCRAASELIGVDVVFYEDEPTHRLEVFEDDGALHIRKPNGFRACFDVGNGQSLCGDEQNSNTRRILTAMKMIKHIGEHTLVDEEEDEECCSECGRPL